MTDKNRVLTIIEKKGEGDERVNDGSEVLSLQNGVNSVTAKQARTARQAAAVW